MKFVAVALVSAATVNNGEDLNEQLLGFFPLTTKQRTFRACNSG
jgi:hypothetical protein